MDKIILLFSVFSIFNNQIASSPLFVKDAIGMFGDKYQGDIKLNEAQQVVLLDRTDPSARTGWTWEGFRWPTDSHGLVKVPYTINEGFCMKKKRNFSHLNCSYD